MKSRKDKIKLMLLKELIQRLSSLKADRDNTLFATHTYDCDYKVSKSLFVR